MPEAKFYFYKAQLGENSPYQTLKQALDETAAKQRADQEVTIDGTPCFISESKQFTRSTGYLFTRVRMTELPSKVLHDGTLEELDLGDDDGLGEDVALAYGRLRNVVAIQSNRHSLSANGIARFLNTNWPEMNIAFNPIMSNDALERYTRCQQMRKVRLKLAQVNDLSFLDRSNLSSSEKILFQQFFQAPYAELILSMGHGRGYLRRNARRLVDYCLNLFRSGNDCVKILEISGKENEHSEMMVIDLLADRLVFSREVELSGRSINRDSLLRVACNALSENHAELSRVAQTP